MLAFLRQERWRKGEEQQTLQVRVGDHVVGLATRLCRLEVGESRRRGDVAGGGGGSIGRPDRVFCCRRVVLICKNPAMSACSKTWRNKANLCCPRRTEARPSGLAMP